MCSSDLSASPKFETPNLKGILKKEDVDFLAESAYKDACRPGNPRDCTVKDIKKLYLSLI